VEKFKDCRVRVVDIEGDKASLWSCKRKGSWYAWAIRVNVIVDSVNMIAGETRSEAEKKAIEDYRYKLSLKDNDG